MKADDTPGVVRFIKIRDQASYIDYGFDIKVEKAGTEDASFEGTFYGVDEKGVEWVGEWVGTFSTLKTREDKITASTVQEPAGLTAGTGDLDRISPISDQSDGYIITGAGIDIPQAYASHYMSQVLQLFLLGLNISNCVDRLCCTHSTTERKPNSSQILAL